MRTRSPALPYAPLQEVRHPKLPSDLGEAGRLAAKGEGRVASDDKERTEARKPVMMSSVMPSLK